jgi:hypothetical protein
MSRPAAPVGAGGDKAILLKSLVLSLMAHLIISQAFVFTFPLHPADTKPHFVFLGSVLNPQEVAVWPPRKDAAFEEDGMGMSLGVENTDKKFVYESREMTGGPFQIPTGEKPLLTRPVDSRGKITAKTTFLTPKEKGDAPTGILTDIMSGHEPTSYKPLRLSP